jgi:hypothetical protein
MPVLPIPAFLLPVAWFAGEVPVSFGSCPWPARERTAVFQEAGGVRADVLSGDGQTEHLAGLDQGQSGWRIEDGFALPFDNLFEGL